MNIMTLFFILNLIFSSLSLESLAPPSHINKEQTLLNLHTDLTGSISPNQRTCASINACEINEHKEDTQLIDRENEIDENSNRADIDINENKMDVNVKDNTIQQTYLSSFANVLSRGYLAFRKKIRKLSHYATTNNLGLGEFSRLNFTNLGSCFTFFDVTILGVLSFIYFMIQLAWLDEEKIERNKAEKKSLQKKGKKKKKTKRRIENTLRKDKRKKNRKSHINEQKKIQKKELALQTSGPIMNIIEDFASMFMIIVALKNLFFLPILLCIISGVDEPNQNPTIATKEKKWPKKRIRKKQNIAKKKHNDDFIEEVPEEDKPQQYPEQLIYIPSIDSHFFQPRYA